jgi:broad specificity phosphatase PhoE
LLRHAETIKDPNTHPKDWLLTPDSLEKIHEYIKDGNFNKITKIISSSEPKAVATGRPVAEYLNLSIEEMEEFVEVKREKKFLTDEEFLVQKQKELEMRNERVNGVESGDEAIARFKLGIQKLEEKNSDPNKIENILIVTHGTILTLFLADYKNNFQNIFESWKGLEFCEIMEI